MRVLWKHYHTWPQEEAAAGAAGAGAAGVSGAAEGSGNNKNNSNDKGHSSVDSATSLASESTNNAGEAADSSQSSSTSNGHPTTTASSFADALSSPSSSSTNTPRATQSSHRRNDAGQANAGDVDGVSSDDAGCTGKQSTYEGESEAVVAVFQHNNASGDSDERKDHSTSPSHQQQLQQQQQQQQSQQQQQQQPMHERDTLDSVFAREEPLRSDADLLKFMRKAQQRLYVRVNHMAVRKALYGSAEVQTPVDSGIANTNTNTSVSTSTSTITCVSPMAGSVADAAAAGAGVITATAPVIGGAGGVGTVNGSINDSGDFIISQEDLKQTLPAHHYLLTAAKNNDAYMSSLSNIATAMISSFSSSSSSSNAPASASAASSSVFDAAEQEARTEVLSLRGLHELAVDLKLLCCWTPAIQAKDKAIRVYLKRHKEFHALVHNSNTDNDNDNSLSSSSSSSGSTSSNMSSSISSSSRDSSMSHLLSSLPLSCVPVASHLSWQTKSEDDVDVDVLAWSEDANMVRLIRISISVMTVVNGDLCNLI